MRTRLRLFALYAAMAISFCAFLVPAGQTQPGDPGIIACRVLEVHASTHPAVIAAVFHQRDKADQARLAALLQNLAAESVELQTADGKWADVTAVRLKSCFGRGLLLLPADGPPLKDGSTFVLKFSPIVKGN
jgi:hypothetical protein